MSYHLVYFVGDATHAFFDYFSGGKSIQSSGPYSDKSEAINASLGRARACIVYNAQSQTITYSQHGYAANSVQELLAWAKANVTRVAPPAPEAPPPHQVETNKGDTNKGDTNKGDTNKGDTNKGDINKGDINKGGVIGELRSPNWAYSKSKHMSHTVEITEFHLAVDNLSKLISATVAGMVGNVPGILQAVSGLTFDLCSSSEDKSDSEAFIKDIVDNDGNKGILVLRASSETKTKKKFWGKNEKKMQVDGVIFVLIPLSEDAKQQCINIENKHASNVLDQIERDFF
jgi:hypothetical protein